VYGNRGVPAGAGGNRRQNGSLKRNLDMEQAFKGGQPPAEYRYYATGRENLPEAIMGLDPDYRQTAKFWREFVPGSEAADKAMQNMKGYRKQEPRAYDILTPDGKVVGVYWSTVYHTRVVMGNDNEIKVYKPRTQRKSGP